MRSQTIFAAEQPLPPYPQNLARMLNENAAAFRDFPVYQEVRDGDYVPLSWGQFQRDIAALQANLQQLGLRPGERVAILSRNRQEMLELEMAVMALGAVVVPIFAGYPANRAEALVQFCEPKMVAVADQEQFDKLGSPEAYAAILHFDQLAAEQKGRLVPFESLLSQTGAGGSAVQGEEIAATTVSLMMYTSGTMGKPKCVQLTHRNILSQQAAMKVLWKLSHKDRFLSYLPWHHSFGGIFEKYAALTNGAVLSLEHGFGKSLQTLLSNWRKVMPTVFFSVPKIYQQLVTLAMQDRDVERLLFHDELRFIFTAAAPLPKTISDLFESRGIPVIEGWGLTETSPCCTITDPEIAREPGVVGKPIPGVALSLADDGEIMVQGPNVMTGYFKNPEASRRVLTDDGWFYTGDVGEFCETGLRLISRKDRIFKLSNAEKVISTEIENLITGDCAFLSHAFLVGNGRNYPVVLLFPNRGMFSQMPDEAHLKPGCKSPKNLGDFACCLSHCLQKLKNRIDVKYARPHAAMLIDYELSIENEELTPSMKLAPNVLARVFKADIEKLYAGNAKPGSEKVYIIDLKENA